MIGSASMGYRVRKSFKVGPGVRLNVSKRGFSTSTKLGPITLNSRGRTTVRLAKGVSYSTSMSTGPTSRRSRPAATSVTNRDKSLVTAYVLWLLTGLLGGHRYYLGRRKTGLLQTLTLGGLGLWWLLDLFLVPGMARKVA